MSGRRTIGVALLGCALAATFGGRAAPAAMNPQDTDDFALIHQAPGAAVTPPRPTGEAVKAPQPRGNAATAPQAPSKDAPAVVSADGAADDAAVAPRPFEGSLGAGLAEVRRLTEAESVDAALAVADRLLAPDPAARLRAWLERQSGGLSERALGWFDTSLAGPLRALGLDPGTSAERAEVHYARGVALRVASRGSEAREAYGLVRGLGGAARPDAVYELGHIALLAGEGWRSEIPELAPPGAQPPVAPQPSPPAAAAPGAAEPEKPDPLQEARRAYQSALDAFVERLRIDWRDADTRANVELVRRRLRELDELEQQRKEQQEQQKQQEQQGQDQQQKDQQQDQQQKDPEQDQQQKDPEQQDPKQDPEQQQDPQQAESEQEKPEPEPGEKPEEEPGKEEAPQPTPEPEEGQMTKEQLQRLQQLLEEQRKIGEETYKALQQRARGRSGRDW